MLAANLLDPVDESIFRQMLRPHLEDGEDHPWIISASILSGTNYTSQADVAYLNRWEAFANAFARLTFDPALPGYDPVLAARVREASAEAYRRLGSRPSESEFRTVAVEVFKRYGAAEAIVAAADRAGSQHADTIPAWVFSDEQESHDDGQPAVTVTPTLPTGKFGCEALFFYCPNTRTVRLQTLEGPAILDQCLAQHRELLSSDSDYSARFKRTMGSLATAMKKVDPASSVSIIEFTRTLYSALEESAIAEQLQAAVDSRLSKEVPTQSPK